MSRLVDEMTELMPPAPAVASSAATAVIDYTVVDSDADLQATGPVSDMIDALSKRLAVDIVMKLPVVVIPVSSKASHT